MCAFVVHHLITRGNVPGMRFYSTSGLIIFLIMQHIIVMASLSYLVLAYALICAAAAVRTCPAGCPKNTNICIAYEPVEYTPQEQQLIDAVFEGKYYVNYCCKNGRPICAKGEFAFVVDGRSIITPLTSIAQYGQMIKDLIDNI